MSNPEQLGRKLFENRTGILLGGLIGLFSGGFIGLLFGGAVGYGIQTALAGFNLMSLNPREKFFEATFAVMGKLAKADGRVTEREIEFARSVMARMGLSEERRRQAIDLFTRGKESDFDIDEVMVPLARLIRHRDNLRLMFIEIQLQAALVDGQISTAELALIQSVCSHLGINYSELEQILFRSRAEQSFHASGGVNPQQALKDAYGVLGVEPGVADGDLKRAYRKLMSQHHPDKLAAKGLPEEMMQLAKEKTQEIQAAYDLVRKQRGGR